MSSSAPALAADGTVTVPRTPFTSRPWRALDAAVRTLGIPRERLTFHELVMRPDESGATRPFFTFHVAAA